MTMKVVEPRPQRDTLMACFCRILFGMHGDIRAKRLWVRRELLATVRDDAEFVWRHQRENCVYDKDRLCGLFAQRFAVNVEFPTEQLRFTSPFPTPFTLYLVHLDGRRFVQLVPERRKEKMLPQFDLRKTDQDQRNCPVVGTFSSQGQLTLKEWDTAALYTVHPQLAYEVVIPSGQHLYVFAQEECVATVGAGDSVHPYFFIPHQDNYVTLSIIVADSITRAKQFLATKLYGVF